MGEPMEPPSGLVLTTESGLLISPPLDSGDMKPPPVEEAEESGPTLLPQLLMGEAPKGDNCCCC